ncbi:Kringle, partial [Trinorchestia longiramus]
CLTLTNSTGASGRDGIGAWVGVVNTYTTELGTRMLTLAKAYEDSDVTVFETTFPDGVLGCDSGSKDTVCSGYPVFSLPEEDSGTDFLYVTPGDSMVGWNLFSQGHFWSSHDQFRDGERGGIAGFIIPGSYSLVLSPLNRPMAVNNWLNVEGNYASLQYGVEGLAGTIPAGFSVSVIAVTGLSSPDHNSSFVNTVMKWGENVQKESETSKMEDLTTEYLGFWTDNGAYYYYNDDEYDNYEDLIVSLYNYAQKEEIPIRYVQLDSWWYYKGLGDGVKNWTARPDIFPNGIQRVYNLTHWPILAHNRYFASDTDYATQNGGEYPFYIEESTLKAVPLDKSFWDDLFDEALEWGLAVYEQDWLDREYEEVSVLHTNVTLGDDWLHNMATSAGEREVPVQYCMSLPREAVHGGRESVVTQIRVSDDYHLASNQWMIGHTSLFAYALGMRPFKDVFWTSYVNKNNPFTWCQFYQPTTEGIVSNYVGHVNVSESGASCVFWDDIDFRARYPTYTLPENFCRNPGNLHSRAFCFTEASLDTPEEEWVWEYCDVPTCEIDCYVRNGRLYVGNQSITTNGFLCVDWDGEFGLTGAHCRNPEGTEDSPWCYIDEDHTQIDFCDNICPEAVEDSPYLQSAVATLSKGPVGIGDKMENINRDLVMRSCRSDGLLLQFSKPLTAIDLYFTSDSMPKIWTAETTLASQYTFALIFIAEVSEEFDLTPAELNIEKSLSTDIVLWQHYPFVADFSNYPANATIHTPSRSGFDNFTLLATSPIYSVAGSQYAILGETNKWAYVSEERIIDIEVDEDTLNVIINVAPADEVVMSF